MKCLCIVDRFNDQNSSDRWRLNKRVNFANPRWRFSGTRLYFCECLFIFIIELIIRFETVLFFCRVTFFFQNTTNAAAVGGAYRAKLGSSKYNESTIKRRILDNLPELKLSCQPLKDSQNVTSIFCMVFYLQNNIYKQTNQI